MIRFLTFLVLVGSPALSADWPDGLAREGECAVCAMRGGEHGTERYVAWREHEGDAYGFCSEDCASAFDQMPAGFAPPVLPRTAPAFRWEALDGSVIVPTGQRALLVDFWATWCAPCLKTIPALEALADEFGEQGLRVVGISIDEDPAVLEAYLERRPIAYHVVHDGSEDPAWWQFRVPAIPAAFLVDGRGEIVAQWNGEVDLAELRAGIEGLVRED